MLNIGAPELVIILVIALLVLGPKRLPEMGRSLGRTVREFQKATKSVTQELGVDEVLREVNDVKQTVTGSFQSVTDSVNDVKQTVSGSYEQARDGLKIEPDARADFAGAPDDEVLTGEVVDEEPPTGEVVNDEPPTDEVVDDESPTTAAG